MSDKTSGLNTCRNTSWIVGALLGLAAFLLMYKVSAFWALLAGVVLAAVVALVLQRVFCTGGSADKAVMGSDMADLAGSTLAAVGADKTRAASAVPGAGEGERDADAVVEAHSEAVAAAAGNLDEAASAFSVAAHDASAASVATAKSEKPVADGGPKGATPKVSTAGKTQVETPKPADGKPELLAAPADGKGDDLKAIKGVGPKLETALHEMGVWHFSQIAGWSETEVAWMDANLAGFKGRVSRDNWVEQARLLAGGGETEFSKRVKEGDVY